MSSTTTSSTNFQSILDAAFLSYATQTGIDITKHSSADKLQDCHSPDDIIRVLLDRETAFKNFREIHHKFIDLLYPIVKVVHAFSGILAEAAGIVPFQPTKAIFVSIDILLSAALGVSASYDALTDVFECVSSFLRRLRIYTEEIPLSHAMSDIIVRILVEVLSVFALATKQINQGRIKKFTKKLLGESEVEAILQRLDRLTQEESRMTTTHTFGVVHGLFKNLTVVTDGIIRETANKIYKLECDQLQEKIRKWLSPPDPWTNHNIARRDHLKGTASWFKESSTFKEWNATGSLLWVHGKPGAGKSVLCSSIIEEVEGLHDTGLAMVAYFYCDFRNSKKQEISDILASLIAQLSAKPDPCYDIVSALYSTFDAGSRRPADNALIDCLERMLKIEGQPRTYIIIDAIDESPNRPGVVPPRERVLELVERLVHLRLSNLRICVTSRPEADIRASLAPLSSKIVSLHDQDGQKQDISHYVIYNVNRNMRRWKEEDKKMVIDSLTRKADGMFRWIVCQLEALRNCFPSAICRALDDLPKSLDETYDRILLGIASELQEIAKRLLQCLAISIRPLHVEELADILAIQFNPRTLPNYKVDWRPEDSEEAVIFACSSLITIVDLDGSRVVQFSHYSVKEYLTSERLANAEKHLSYYHILPRSAHVVIAQASLSVLLALDGQVDKESIRKFPLANYAAQYWVDHARFEDVSSSIEDSMICLFDPAKPHFSTWVWIHDIDYPLRPIMLGRHPTSPETVPLYYATLCGFRDLVKHLIVTCPEHINATGGYYSTPLHAAVAKGNGGVTMLLLNHGADVAALDKYKRSPLDRASARAEIASGIMELLLDHHADVDTNDAFGTTSLYRASLKGELDVARILLRHGAAVDFRDTNGCTSLYVSSYNGHVDVVRLLLQNGAVVDSSNNDGWTPLKSASRNGYSDIVRLLLQTGAIVDSCDNDGWTPLMSASQGGHLDVVHLLLQSGATTDLPNKEGATPLMIASQNGHVDVVRLLLQNGAVVDPRSNDGWTPLTSASRDGYADIVHLLLQSGAIVDSYDNGGWTPLMSASQEGHLDVVHLLLQSSATIELRNKWGATPLMMASQNGHLDVVHLLLQNSANVDSRRNDLPTSSSDDKSYYFTPLHLASAKGHLIVSELLVQCGADVNALGQDQETPLHLAIRYGQLNVSDIVHAQQISLTKIDPRDRDDSTSPHRVAQSGHFNVAVLLLKSGANVNIRNSDNKTAFELAHDVLERLVEASLPHSVSSDRPAMESLGEERIGSIDPKPLDTPSQGSEPSHNTAQKPPLGLDEATTIPNQRRTSLHVASEEGDLETVRSLLDGGVDVNERNSSQDTALLLAMFCGRFEVARLLIEYGADVNSHDKVGLTSLFAATQRKRLDMVYLLLDHGADVNAKDQEQRTALHVASYYGLVGIAQALVQRGAHVHVRNVEGWTPSQLAQRNGYREVVQLLSEYSAQEV